MGYTRYYKNDSAIPQDIWDSVADKFRSQIPGIESAMGDTLHGPDGTGSPIINSDEIDFNGNSSDDNDHENMHVWRSGGDWAFCKTARKPYDLAVAVLIQMFIRAGAPGISDSSDGSTEWDSRVSQFL